MEGKAESTAGESPGTEARNQGLECQRAGKQDPEKALSSEPTDLRELLHRTQEVAAYGVHLSDLTILF